MFLIKATQSSGEEMSSLAKSVQESGEAAKIGWCPPWPRMQFGRHLKGNGPQVCSAGVRLELPESGRSQEFQECHFNPSLSGNWTFEPSHWQGVGSKS